MFVAENTQFYRTSTKLSLTWWQYFVVSSFYSHVHSNRLVFLLEVISEVLILCYPLLGCHCLNSSKHVRVSFKKKN